MISRYIWLLGWWVTPLSFANDIAPRLPNAAVYLGEAQYEARLGHYLTAITRLKTQSYLEASRISPVRDPQPFQPTAIDLAAADIELSYRLPERAEHILKTSPIVEGDAFAGEINLAYRNNLAYRLARYYVNHDQPQKALQAINKIYGLVSDKTHIDEMLVRSQIYMAYGRFEDAVSVLQGIPDDSNPDGVAAYNLGIALFLAGKTKQGIAQMDETGQLTSADEEILALKDKANLLLGYRLLESGQPQSAKLYLDRVRLAGPFSNKALLGAGWVYASLGTYERALVPWTLLMKRSVTDENVQESFLAVPYAYSKLGLYGKAIQLYDNALQNFDVELAMLDRSIRNIRTGKYIQAIATNEFKQNKDWLVKLRELPEAAETYYLLDLMSSRKFQTALSNYTDLNELMERLTTWRADIESWQELVDLRRNHYEPLLPTIDVQFETLMVRNAIRQQQRHRVDDSLQNMLLSPQPDLLAMPGERKLKRNLVENLRVLEKTHAKDTREEIKQIRLRSKRLIGLMQWQIEMPYEQRLELFKKGPLIELAKHEEGLADIYETFFIQRKIAAQSYLGHDDSLGQLKTRVQDAQGKVATLLARQGHLLEEMAIVELGLRRKRLEEYQLQIIFAQAEIYNLTRKKPDASPGSSQLE